MSMHKIELRHNFETAHRLSHPDAPKKCQSIHGHSWWVRISITSDRLDERGMIVEFGSFKSAWRKFLDSTIDHHLVLRAGDPMAAAIKSVDPESRILELDTDPTTELLAQWVFERSQTILQTLHPQARVVSIHLQETSVNAASYSESE
jgi:6-pyruvoyltetrahydropterin/6-carboxytetrahydropterin synthase